MKGIFRRKNKYLIIFLTIVLFMSTCSTAFGTEEKGSTLVVDFSIGGESIEGVGFNAYKIGYVNNDGGLVLEDAYRDYPVVWNIETAEQMKEICDTLMGYIDRDKIVATEAGVTDGEGKAEMKAESKGIYLVVGSLYETEDVVYSISPALVKIDEEDTRKEIQPKYEKETKPREDITAVKIWTGDKEELFRPKMIEAELYKDGELFDTVELSEENGWKHIWQDMSTESIWTVAEKTVLKEFHVRVSRKENVFFIKNDLDTGLHGMDDKRDDSPSNPPEDIPYTGTLWWPVPIMAIGGVVLLWAGNLAKRER